MGQWKETSKESVFKTFIFELFSVGFKSEQSGKEGKFHVLESNDWVNIVPVTENNEVLMVKQFRYGTREMSLEFPAGGMEPGENPMDAAMRELLEETGGIGQTVLKIGSCRPNSAILNNSCHHFVAKGVRLQKAQELDHFEEIDIEIIPVEKIDQMIRDGKITQALSIAAWQFFKLL